MNNLLSILPQSALFFTNTCQAFGLFIILILHDGDVNINNVCMFRGLIHIIIVPIINLFLKKKLDLTGFFKTSQQAKYVIGSQILIVVLVYLLQYNAVLLPINNLMAVTQINPIIGSFIAVILFKQGKLRIFEQIGTLFCFIAVILIVKPDCLSFLQSNSNLSLNLLYPYKTYGYILAIIVAVLIALVINLISYVTKNNIDPLIQMFYQGILFLTLPSILMLFEGGIPILSTKNLLLTLLLGLVSFICALLDTWAYGKDNPARLMIMNYLQIFWGFIIDFIRGVPIDCYSIIGALIIVFTTLLMPICRIKYDKYKENDNKLLTKNIELKNLNHDSLEIIN